jgi:two-component system cell cycle response regulator DivK
MPQKKLVMIVEDNDLNLKLFRDLLEAHGYATLHTRDGFQVLDLVRKHNPNLILMDIQLPEVSGIEITGWLKADEKLKDIPVIAITAFAMRGDEEKIRAGGCDDYLAKPIAVHQFISTVKKYL